MFDKIFNFRLAIYYDFQLDNLFRNWQRVNLEYTKFYLRHKNGLGTITNATKGGFWAIPTDDREVVHFTDLLEAAHYVENKSSKVLEGVEKDGSFSRS